MALITLQEVEGEPRVLDTDLAAALGMPTPANIRKNVITPNILELQGLGVVASSAITPGVKGGRPGTAYYLNEEQALLVCIFSQTPKARQIRAEVIRVFVAWRKGTLKGRFHPDMPNFADPIASAQAWLTEAKRA